MIAILVVWFVLVSLGIYEAARGAMFSLPEALALGLFWPIIFPVTGLFLTGLSVVDVYRSQH